MQLIPEYVLNFFYDLIVLLFRGFSFFLYYGRGVWVIVIILLQKMNRRWRTADVSNHHLRIPSALTRGNAWYQRQPPHRRRLYRSGSVLRGYLSIQREQRMFSTPKLAFVSGRCQADNYEDHLMASIFPLYPVVSTKESPSNEDIFHATSFQTWKRIENRGSRFPKMENTDLVKLSIVAIYFYIMLHQFGIGFGCFVYQLRLLQPLCMMIDDAFHRQTKSHISGPAKSHPVVTRPSE